MIANNAPHYKSEDLITELKAAVELLTYWRCHSCGDAAAERSRWKMIESKEFLIDAIEKELLGRLSK